LVQDEAKAFYIDKLGFREATDVTMGDGYRWVTVCHPDHPELELTLMKPGPPLDEEDAFPSVEGSQHALILEARLRAA
jgi:catechol 2,3-dioxygenase-like lactoylglutathione lyase family enzyme